MTGEIDKLTDMGVAELYSARTACAYLLHLGLLTAPAADELVMLGTAIDTEINERPRPK